MTRWQKQPTGIGGTLVDVGRLIVCRILAGSEFQVDGAETENAPEKKIVDLARRFVLVLEERIRLRVEGSGLLVQISKEIGQCKVFIILLIVKDPIKLLPTRLAILPCEIYSAILINCGQCPRFFSQPPHINKLAQQQVDRRNFVPNTNDLTAYTSISNNQVLKKCCNSKQYV